MAIKTISYMVDFSIEGDEAVGIKGLEAQLLGYRMNFGKALTTIAKLKQLPRAKPKEDCLGLRRMAKLID